MKNLIYFILLMPFTAMARGGGGGNGGIFFGLIGIAIAFILSRIVGEKIIPNEDSSFQTIVGFFTIIFCFGILIKIFN